jgi:hypothetical protein
MLHYPLGLHEFTPKSVYFYDNIAFRLTDLHQIDTLLPPVVVLRFSFLSVNLFSSDSYFATPMSLVP